MKLSRLLLVSMMLASTHSYAKEIATPNSNPSTVTIFSEIYSTQSGEFNKLQQNKGLKPDDEYYSTRDADYNEILDVLKNTLSTKGRTVVDSSQKDKADFQVIFIDLPFFIQKDSDHANFSLPPNPHALTASSKKELTSPWLNATLFLDKAQKLVGGTIIIKKAPFAQLGELHKASQNKWQELAHMPTNADNTLAVDPEFFSKIITLYTKKFYNQYPAPSKKSLDEAFSSEGESGMLIAHLAAISPQTTLAGPFEGEVADQIQKCQNQSKLFYLKLYDYLFKHIANSNVKLGENQYYNFLPSSAIYEHLNQEVSGYNCFIK